MAKSLFQRLLNYQSTNTRSNLENYLTEMLCDLLNRLDVTEQKNIVSGMIEGQGPLGFEEKLYWETQVPIYLADGCVKFPDLVGYRKEVPYVVIESKVDAGFTEHAEQSVGSEEQDILHQLEVYGKWLSSRSMDGLLILLTKSTKPPATFLETTKKFKYGLHARYMATWQRLYETLGNCTQYQLADDFRQFMISQGVAMENPNRMDFAALEMCLNGAAERFSEMVQSSRNSLRKEYGDIKINWNIEDKWISQGFKFDYKDSMLWTWAVRNAKPYTYIGWGFHFPDKNRELISNWREVLEGDYPRQPFWFMGVFTNSTDEGKRIATQLSDEWYKSNHKQDGEYIAAVVIDALDTLLESEQVGRTFHEWVSDYFRQAHDTL